MICPLSVVRRSMSVVRCLSVDVRGPGDAMREPTTDHGQLTTDKAGRSAPGFRAIVERGDRRRGDLGLCPARTQAGRNAGTRGGGCGGPIGAGERG